MSESESNPKLEQLLEIVKSLNKDAEATVKQEVFNFIRKFWSELGDQPIIKEAVCKKLDIGPAQFNMLLTNPDLAYGAETLHRNIRAGWLKDYLDYTSGHEAPEDFHVWVGLTVVGAALRRRAYIPNVYYNLYPNLFTILVAPPGIGKKTTAINIGVSLLREAVAECRIISEKVTPEALAKRLSKPIEVAKDSGGLRLDAKAEGLIVAPELTVFLGREQYNEGLILFLTRLFDSADTQETETIARGVEKLHKVCVSLLGATTPSEINKAIPASAKGSGFMSRLMLIQRDTTPRVVPFATPVDATIKEMLVRNLKKIHDEHEGPFTVTPEATKWYDHYYRRHSELKNSGEVSLVSIERQPDFVFKLGMILSAAEGCGMVVREDHFQRGLSLILAANRNCGDTLKMIDTSDRGRTSQLVLQAISKEGGLCSRGNILRRLYRHANGAEVDVCLATLRDAGVIREFTQDKAKWYKLSSLEDM